jgi:hypothetical protein
LPGSPAAARRVLAPASSPTAGGVPSIRWGASGWVASEPFLWTASLEPETGPREPTAQRVVRGAGIRRRHGYSARSVARRPWVQALGCARLWASARPNLQGKTPRLDGRLPEVPDAAHDATSKADASGISTARSWPRRAGVRPAGTHANNHERKKNTARRSDLQNTRLGASPPRGTAARRGVSLGSANRGAARRQHQERPTSQLGVATERGLHKTARRNVETSLVPRTATAALKSTSGSGAPSVAARQFCGSKASIQARFNGRHVSTSWNHRREKTMGEKRIEWPGGAHGGVAV